MMRAGIRIIFFCAVGAVATLILLWTVARQPRIVVPPDSGYTIKQSGDYYEINFTATAEPPEPNLLSSLHYGFPFRSCWRYARSIQEPLTESYGPRTYVPSIGADAPRAISRWPGPIYKSAFDKAANNEWPDCTHCMDIVAYKILSGRLYVAQRARPCIHRDVAEEMLKVLLHMFPIPDMEFLLHFGDGCTNGLPVIGWNICRQHANAGFTMPSYSVWQSSLGPTQMLAYHTCLHNRYPAKKRKPLAIWRGSTTDTRHEAFNAGNYLEALRVQLHQLARNHTDILDARISNPINCDAFVASQLSDLGSRLEFEDFNSYCAILDVDGNGWSDRFAQLVHFNTPVLKVASNFTGFFEHLFAPGAAMTQFSRDLSDLPSKVREAIADCKGGEGGDGEGGGGGEEGAARRRRQVHNKQAAARLLLNHVGILEGFAYTLQRYRNASTWAVEPTTEGYVEVRPSCCAFTNLPKAFAQAVSEGPSAVERRLREAAAVGRRGSPVR